MAENLAVQNCVNCGAALDSEPPATNNLCRNCARSQAGERGLAVGSMWAEKDKLHDPAALPLGEQVEEVSSGRGPDAHVLGQAAGVYGEYPAAAQPEKEAVLDPDRPHWGPLSGIGVWVFSVFAIILVPLFALLVWYFIEQGRGASIPLTREGITEWAASPPAVLVQVISTAAAHLLTLLLCWVVVTRFGRRPFLANIGWPWEGRSGFYKFTFIIAIVGISIMINVALARILPQSEETIFDKLLKSSEQVRIAVAILAVFSAPLVEEAVYRGVLFSALRSRLGLASTVLVVTTLFASLHFIQYWGAWAGLAGLTAFSLVLTVIRAKTKSLFPCVVAHTLYNCVGAIAILMQKTPPQ